MNPIFYLYILYSTNSDLFYVGYSTDPWRRLIEHNTVDHNTYTSKHRPWKLVAVFQAGVNEGNAVQIERFIKKQKSKQLLLRLIDPRFEPNGVLAQLVRVPHVRD